MADKKKWIKLWPEGLMSWEYFNTPGMLDFWVRLLLLASKNDGVIVTTEMELARFCNTTRQRVRTMLANQESTKMITKSATKGATKSATKITICNWARYQDCQPREQPSDQPAAQPTDQPRINQEEASIPISSFLNEKSKHIEKREEKETTTIVVAKKEAAALSLAQREKIFYESLIPFLDSKGGQYPAEMLRAFFRTHDDTDEVCHMGDDFAAFLNDFLNALYFSA